MEWETEECEGFDHALTDVSLFQIHFIKVKTELLIVKVQITLESKWTG